MAKCQLFLQERITKGALAFKGRSKRSGPCGGLCPLSVAVEHAECHGKFSLPMAAKKLIHRVFNFPHGVWHFASPTLSPSSSPPPFPQYTPSLFFLISNSSEENFSLLTFPSYVFVCRSLYATHSTARPSLFLFLFSSLER